MLKMVFTLPQGNNVSPETLARYETRRIARHTISHETSRLYQRAGCIALIGNILLFAAKGIVAWLSGSSAIYADAANSGSDVAYSLLMLVGLWLSVRPADATHPHGHQRIEPMVSLIIGAMMTFAGVEAARTGIERLLSGPQAVLSYWALAIPLVTVGVKTGMYALVRRIGRAVHSPAILASARDNLSDILTSLVALLGVGTSRLSFPVADPIAALLVSAWIFRGAFFVLREAIQQLIGGAGSAELDERIERAALAVPGVQGIEQLVAEFVGPKVWIDIHVLADRSQTLEETHRFSHAVREALEALPEVERAFVHVEPYLPPGDTR